MRQRQYGHGDVCYRHETRIYQHLCFFVVVFFADDHGVIIKIMVSLILRIAAEMR